ncbi:hypothetical protein PpBr36_03670 [Pyricularia pennisetigena]|uniref:hypothetical protein n=1 Tax=Pyricularia pennisetigena TaxID=1578925 RepID=UPI00114FB59D|nr:hypothetical protein PpBr36_03670 [Pyricularia pennisetigena]TLS30516.1 hypothetical protein PpBr36_03670 [Pyricularia pennisetigena]
MTEHGSASDKAERPPVKSNSTASAAKSYVSVPVTGVHPYGSLQIHQQPGPRQGPEPGSADGMPALSSDDLLGEGDVFLILDLPKGFTVGCDMAALTLETARPVLGFRGLPPGAHLVWVSDPQQMSRCGYWFVTAKQGGAGMVRVKQWDRYNEVLGEPASQFEARSHRDNLASFYQKLLPYNIWQDGPRRSSPFLPKDHPSRDTSDLDPDLGIDKAAVWHHLTSSVTEDLLRRVTGCPLPDTREWRVDTTDTTKGEVNFAQASKLFKAVVGSELTFLFPRDDSGLDLNQLTTGEKPASPDTTALVTSVIDRREDVSEADAVGELQFAFLTAVHLGNPSCLDYWLHFVLRVLLRAHRLVVDRPALARSLITTLRAQLVYSDRYVNASSSSSSSYSFSSSSSAAATADNDDAASRGIMDSLPQNSKSRLREALVLYKRRLNESLLQLGDAVTQPQAAVGHAFADLEAWFWKYGWDLRSGYVPPPRGAETSAAGGDDDDDDEDEDDDNQMQSTQHKYKRRPGLETHDDGDSDDEEYLPVVVELDDDGRQVGLVSWNT